MPVIDDPAFVRPSDGHTKLWRYMDFTKFVSMLANRALYFTRVDMFEDPFEGSIPLARMARNHAQDEFVRKIVPKASSNFLSVHREVFSKYCRMFMAANCWHKNEHESEAMWRIYLSSSEGVAIRTTYQRLLNVLNQSDETAYIGEVRYIDYRTEDLPNGPLSNLTHKRRSFVHEQELRAIVARAPDFDGSHPDPMNDAIMNRPTMDHGCSVEVNLIELIECIFVCPYSPKWFYPLIRETTKAFGYQLDIRRSDMTDTPNFG